MKTLDQNLFEAGTSAAAYAVIHERLSSLREEFHRSGRLDDSNAKLDEVIKLFATNLAFRLGDIEHFPDPFADQGNFIDRLQEAFRAAARVAYFTRNDGISIFGVSPSLVFSQDDSELAKRLCTLVIDAISEAFEQHTVGNPYDILNEAFGHFVRDNFRGNTEDAQYLTPAEVVDFMAEMVMHDLKLNGRLEMDSPPIVMADPCCGVGSFLTAFAAKYRDTVGVNGPALEIHGQDKVERMVRIATVNLALFRLFEHSITIGNSIYAGSPLDDLNDKVDVILTNPPFGARFSSSDVALQCGANTPFFSRMHRLRGPFESELLFIDRSLALLREGGCLLIVVPDGVISSSGLASLLRSNLQETAQVRAVIDLPAVTFAQAGTRTRTSVVYLQKRAKKSPKPTTVFMAIADDLGYQVNSRKGVKVKLQKGANQLPAILAEYKDKDLDSIDLVRSVRIPLTTLADVWTPGFYIANARHSTRKISSDVVHMALGDLVEFTGDGRKQQKHRTGQAYISVLHVLGEGLLDIAAARSYSPKTPGVPVEPGEVLLSRINPRIPRVIVTPDLSQPMLCSSEFEVMRPKTEWDAFTIAYILLAPSVQRQVQSLTSGTSASHNRIKTRDLATIQLPMPRAGSEKAARLKKRANAYGAALRGITKANLQIASLREEDQELV